MPYLLTKIFYAFLDFAEWRFKDPQLHFRVNIGFAVSNPSRKELQRQRFEERKKVKNNFELEKAARNKTCKFETELYRFISNFGIYGCSHVTLNTSIWIFINPINTILCTL